jgi:hypothetical protein
MKNYYFKITIASFLVLMLFSCSKNDEFLTSGEKNAQQLEELITNRGITSIAVYEYVTYGTQYEDWVFVIDGKSSETEFVESFFKIQDQYFNLENLEKFTILGNVMRLYFR